MGTKSVPGLVEETRIKKIDHIGIVVKSIDETLEKWESLFKTNAQRIETVKEHSVRVAFVPLGGVLIEFLEPTQPGVGRSGEFLEKYGEGFHHIAYRVDNLETFLKEMKEEEVSLCPLHHKDWNPLHGSRGSIVAFIDSKETNNVSIELVELKDDSE